ncbi:MAG: YbdK family carboxylate-amine ligase [Solirubrobacteraceae bacterium]
MATAAPDPSPFPAPAPPNADELRAAFGGAERHMVGIEDEVMLLDPDSFELVGRAWQVLDLLGPDETRFKLELPASQLEIVTPPTSDLDALAASLFERRRVLAGAAEGVARLACAGVHPFSPGVGELNQLERYEQTIAEHGPIAARQLVCALQVHVGVGDPDRALAVYNAARSYLPLLAALAANAPFYEGVDTGLASVRPIICELLPRQGVPPVISSWKAFADVLRWGAASGAFPTARTWWWELRPHVGYGTLEFRVPDGQATVGDAIAIAAVVQALVAWLGERHDAGEVLPVAESWQIAQNRWSACRHGVEGTMADLAAGGAARPTRAFLRELLDALAGPAAALGSEAWLSRAAGLITANGAIAQRRVASAEGGDARGAAAWLAERFLAIPSG